MDSLNLIRWNANANDSKFKTATIFPNRPAAQQKVGKEVQMRVNQFKVTQWPQKTVYQYNVRYHNSSSLNNST